MALVANSPWHEPAPRTKKEQDRLEKLHRYETMIGDSEPIFLRAVVMELAGMTDSDWRWQEYTKNRFIEGAVLPGSKYRKYSVHEVRAIRLALRLKRQGVRNHMIKVEVNQFMSRPPVQATLPLHVLDHLAMTKVIVESQNDR